MEYQLTYTLTGPQKEQICELWNREYPVNIRHKQLSDFETYLARLDAPAHRILTDARGTVCGWLVDFTRDGQRWFAMLVAGPHHGQGLGSRLLREAMKEQDLLHGWVIADTGYRLHDGTPYRSPLGFYRKMGFTIYPDRVLETDTLETIMVRWSRQET